jgi:tetratricopeptide (TPR) repeat protein
MGFTAKLWHHGRIDFARVFIDIMRHHLVPVVFVALLSACANQTVTSEARLAEAAVAESTPDSAPERPIPADSVYPLLVAEFALRRGSYGISLHNYLAQAEVLADPAVSARATQLAQFLNREDDALKAAQQWVDLQSDNVEANNTVATLLSRQGRTVEAIPYMARVARGKKSAPFPLLLTGYGSLSDEDRLALGVGMGELAEEFPRDPALLLSHAMLYEEQGKSTLALKKLDKVFEQRPFQRQALLLEAKILMDLEAATPLRHIEQALQTNPRDDQLRLQYARLLTRSSMVAARQQFEILSANAPSNVDLLLSLAIINRENGDTVEAKANLMQMLNLGQRVDEAHYYLGRILEEEGDLENAISEYMAVQEGRDFISANGRISQILFKSGQLDRSHAYLESLRSKYPLRKEQLYALEIELLTRDDDLDGAVNMVNQALQELPESTDLRYARSMLREQQNNLVLMEQDLRAILEQDPNNVTALNALGYTLANRTDRIPEAYMLVSKALALEPEEPAILDSMGWILFRQGKYAEAVLYLNRAYAKYPDAEVAAHLGEALWVSGNRDSALAIWQEAFQKNPEHEVLVETMTRHGVAPEGRQP